VSLGVVLRKSADPKDHQVAAILPIVGASVFHEKNLQKRFWSIFVKNTSFLVIQIAQQSADAVVNNNELNFLVATFDHLIKRSFMSRGGEIPKSICIARHRSLV